MPITVIKKGKSDRLNLRISPKLKYGLELLARKEGKTLSALIEEVTSPVVVERLTEQRKKPGDRVQQEVSILDESWHTLAPDRLVKLAQLAPEYLSDREQTIWTVIGEHAGYWRDETSQVPDMGAIRGNWEAIELQADEYLKKFGSKT